MSVCPPETLNTGPCLCHFNNTDTSIKCTLFFDIRLLSSNSFSGMKSKVYHVGFVVDNVALG